MPALGLVTNVHLPVWHESLEWAKVLSHKELGSVGPIEWLVEGKVCSLTYE
jgi:hypothetical protein